MLKNIKMMSAMLASMLSLQAFAADQPLAATETLKNLEKVALRELPALDLAQVAAEDRKDELNDVSPRFAVPRAVDVSPESEGSWELSADGRHVWRYRVRSDVASSFNFGFTEYFMPKGGELWVYSPDFKSRFGPYTSENNHAHRQLWTPVVLGDDAIIELSLPAKERGNYRLHLTQIGQGYRGFGAKDLTPGPGCKPGGDKNDSAPKSGSCNMDVACLGASDPWQNNRRSVAAQGTNGSRVCTGSLVNNTAGDRSMLYLTATHCLVTAANAPTLFVYWNFDAPTCRLPGSADSGSGAVVGVVNQTQTGATFLAQTNNPFAGATPAGTRSDVTLVRFDNAANPAFNLYWSGWDRQDIASTCSAPGDPTATNGLCASIHHPDGDEKRITFVQENMFTANIASATGVHWQANWDPTPPILPNIPAPQPTTLPPGVTERGSSGSPLYNASRRLVGVLSGGPSACGATGASLADQYGKLSHAWEGLGTATTRVRDYLDPNNSNALFIDGIGAAGTYSLAATPTTVLGCAGQSSSAQVRVASSDGASDLVSMSSVNTPAGVGTLLFSPNAVTPAVNPGALVNVSIPVLPGASLGTVNLTLRGASTTGNVDVNVPLQIVNTPPPAAPTLSVPSAGATGIALNASFSWAASSGANDYRFQLSRDAGFSSLIENKVVSGTSTTASKPLRGNATYFWRVSAQNVCGPGTAATGTFQTVVGDVIFSDGFYE
jgi:lysyl endopeptidase